MRNVKHLILFAVTALAAGDALADVSAVFDDTAPVAGMQLTQNERDQFREQWQGMSPEQRDAVRSRLKERLQAMPPDQREQLRQRLRQEWQNTPPEERQQRREEWLQRLRERDQRNPDDSGYGRGYGNRS